MLLPAGSEKDLCKGPPSLPSVDLAKTPSVLLKKRIRYAMFPIVPLSPLSLFVLPYLYISSQQCAGVQQGGPILFLESTNRNEGNGPVAYLDFLQTLYTMPVVQVAIH